MVLTFPPRRLSWAFRKLACPPQGRKTPARSAWRASWRDGCWSALPITPRFPTLTATASKSATSLEPFSVTAISTNRFMHIRPNRSTPVLYWKQRGILTLPYCPKMGLALFRARGPGVLAAPPTPADWLCFASGSPSHDTPPDWLCSVAPAPTMSAQSRTVSQRIGFVSHFRFAFAPHPSRLASFRTGPLRMRQITHPLGPIRRCSPQELRLSSYTVFTEG